MGIYGKCINFHPTILDVYEECMEINEPWMYGSTDVHAPSALTCMYICTPKPIDA